MKKTLVIALATASMVANAHAADVGLFTNPPQFKDPLPELPTVRVCVCGWDFSVTSKDMPPGVIESFAGTGAPTLKVTERPTSAPCKTGAEQGLKSATNEPSCSLQVAC